MTYMPSASSTIIGPPSSASWAALRVPTKRWSMAAWRRPGMSSGAGTVSGSLLIIALLFVLAVDG